MLSKPLLRLLFYAMKVALFGSAFIKKIAIELSHIILSVVLE